MTGLKKNSVGLGVLAVALGLAACSGPEQRVSPFPVRPTDLSLGGVEACGLLTDDQRAELAVGPGTVTGGSNTTEAHRVALCTQPSPGHLGRAVGSRLSLVGARPSCNLALDVAATATVIATYSDNPTGDPRLPTTGIEQRCANAARLASMVLTSLRAPP